MSIRTRNGRPMTEAEIAREAELEELGRQRKAVMDAQDPFLIRQRLEAEQLERDSRGDYAHSDPRYTPPPERTLEQKQAVAAYPKTERQKQLMREMGIYVE